MIVPAFQYAAVLERIVDADTLVLVVDVGFHVTVTETFRLSGLNAPERFTDAGKAATQFVSDWFAKHPAVVIKSEKPIRQEKYGRFLATITGKDGTELNATMLALNYAVPFMVDRT